MNVIIAGGRDYTNEGEFNYRVGIILAPYGTVTIIHGDCLTGADQLAKRFAEKKEFPCIAFPADWAKFGKSAGPIRNQAMVDYVEALKILPGVNDICICFWDGKSPGTKDMITRAINSYIELYIIRYTK